MKRFLRNKYTKLAKFIVAGSFAALSFLPGTAAIASGGGGSFPTLQLVSISSQFDASDCLYATIAGKNFTYAGPGYSTATLTGGTDFDITPSVVNVGRDGNFEQLISICYNGDEASPVTSVSNYTLSATDSNTNITALTAPVNISDPHPHIHVAIPNVGLTNGCATVTVLGDHFLKSGVVENYAILQFYKYAGTDHHVQYLEHQPWEVNVLGGGNIIIAASVCGLSKGDQFFVQATDEGSFFITDPVALQAH
jgi:hypothetical protein